MGADVLYFSPCCSTEDFEEYEDGYCVCNECGGTFPTEDIIKEVLEYDKED